MNGNFQGPTGVPVSFGYITFELNVNAVIIASPFGQIPGNAGRPVAFQLDQNGSILPNVGASAQIFSNAELQPQNNFGLGTWYAVSIYTQNGARVSAPMSWQFPEATGATVDLSTMTPISQTGGNVIFNAAPVLLTGNNTFTGSNIFNGSVTLGAAIVAATSITSPIFISANVPPAQSGVIRLANADTINWRNFAQNGDLSLQNGGTAFGGIPVDSLVWTGGGISASAFVTGNSPSTAHSGAFRLISQGQIAWRGGADSSDLSLGTDAFDRLAWLGVATFGTLIEATSHTPSSDTDTGTTGQFAWSSTFFYVCIAPNTWVRTALTGGF